MARTKGKGLEFDLTGLIEDMGVEKVVEVFGDEQVLKAVDLKKVVKKKGVDWLRAQLTPEQLKELTGRQK
jgi:hypothetical protein